MSKKVLYMGVLLLVMVNVTACGLVGSRINKNLPKSEGGETLEKNKAGETTFTKDFGSYTIAVGWVENKEHSTKDNFFYVKEGTENEMQPNNIAVGIGKNSYSADEHEQFKDAIMRQMAIQIANSEGVTLTAAGMNTANGDVVYLFTITEEDTGIVTNQYYIVGEKKYCLIQETNFDESTESNEVAIKIVDTFKWEE